MCVKDFPSALQDRNDFRPQISVLPSGTINVPETASINTEIANFDATDNDTPVSSRLYTCKLNQCGTMV